MLPHVFELFSQADTSDTRAQGGLGIGLTLVRTLVDMHGGHITAASAGLDQGSEFTVTLPLTSETATIEAVAPQPDSANGRSARVLIIDDNRAAVYLLEKLLTRLGQTVAVANDGEEAISLAPEFKPDIVFSDIAMPGMSGYELLPHLVQASRRTGRILWLSRVTGRNWIAPAPKTPASTGIWSNRLALKRCAS